MIKNEPTRAVELSDDELKDVAGGHYKTGGGPIERIQHNRDHAVMGSLVGTTLAAKHLQENGWGYARKGVETWTKLIGPRGPRFG